MEDCNQKWISINTNNIIAKALSRKCNRIFSYLESMEHEITDMVLDLKQSLLACRGIENKIIAESILKRKCLNDPWQIFL